ncbi:hypothetical protein KIW84_057539 [Lathyrus oleraceus]|uniref:Uncharacterized protein n=1 Tax=Pisum sativum TaxID=3888 RepID=A0A9D4X3Y4_PEA|nr:hypothetical protein KIW84_057539 [Pisum sativum]
MDHYQGLTKSFNHGKIYCSFVTARLVNMNLGISYDKLHILPLNQKIEIAGGTSHSCTIGKERLFLEVAHSLRKKVYVTAAKLRLLNCLEFTKEDMQWFISNEHESNIHVALCGRSQESNIHVSMKAI